MSKHLNFDTHYIESIPPIERSLYIRYFQKEIADDKKTDGEYTALDDPPPENMTANNLNIMGLDNMQ